MAQLVKMYGRSEDEEPVRRYSPLVGNESLGISDNLDSERVSTSLVESHNLTMRTSMRRFNRLTDAVSKKVENHVHALALYFVWYNSCAST